MASVTTNATGQVTGARSRGIGHATGELIAIALLALVVALTAPLDVVTLGVLVIGVAHVVLELRYVIGRHPAVVQGRLAVIVQASLAAVIVVRLVPGAGAGGLVEISVFGLLLAAAAVSGAAGDGRALAAGLAVTVIGLAVALASGSAWFIVLAHLHNLVPALFLWDWSRRKLTGPARRSFRLLTLGWALVVPALFLTGALDPLLATGSHWSGHVFGLDKAIGTVAPARWRTGAIPLRLLGAFAFAQLVHYGVWVWFLPRHGSDVTARFDAGPAGAVLRGRRLPILVVAGTAAVVTIALMDYRQGRTLYGALGGYHAYLEYPVLLHILVTHVARRRHPCTT